VAARSSQQDHWHDCQHAERRRTGAAAIFPPAGDSRANGTSNGCVRRLQYLAAGDAWAGTLRLRLEHIAAGTAAQYQHAGRGAWGEGSGARERAAASRAVGSAGGGAALEVRGAALEVRGVGALYSSTSYSASAG